MPALERRLQGRRRPTLLVSKQPASPETVATARAAGLRYVNDDEPGISRRRAGKGFSYLDANGRPVRDPATLARIQSLVIPPAWTGVWICRSPDGHIQATGRDQRQRKQYRYHPRWQEIRDETKFERILQFGRRLPEIRARVEADTAGRKLSRERVLATVVRLLDVTLIRVGNDEYARTNQSFGLTTLQDQHVAVDGDAIRFEFRAKSGKLQRLSLRNRRLARIVKSCQELPGQELFQYIDEDGVQRDVTSNDVNEYIRSVAGDGFTAKDFRTWAATVLAALALAEFERFDSKAAAKRNLTQAIKRVASRLGNTPAVCRKCYIHPEVMQAYLDGAELAPLKERIEEDLRHELAGLDPAEAAVLAFLQKRLEAATRRAGAH